MNHQSLIESKIREERLGDEIVFALGCDCCGQTYRTFPIRIDEMLETVEDARTAARLQAASDFSDILTQCLCCKRFVCDQCVVVDKRGHLCKDCAGK